MLNMPKLHSAKLLINVIHVLWPYNYIGVCVCVEIKKMIFFKNLLTTLCLCSDHIPLHGTISSPLLLVVIYLVQCSSLLFRAQCGMDKADFSQSALERAVNTRYRIVSWRFHICPSPLSGEQAVGRRPVDGSSCANLTRRRRVPLCFRAAELSSRLADFSAACLCFRTVPSDATQPLQHQQQLQQPPEAPASAEPLRGCIVEVRRRRGIMTSCSNFRRLRFHLYTAVVVMATGILVTPTGASRNASAPGTPYFTINLYSSLGLCASIHRR